jgi:hypothetical protein
MKFFYIFGLVGLGAGTHGASISTVDYESLFEDQLDHETTNLGSRVILRRSGNLFW